MAGFILNTRISTRAELDATDLAPFDEVYLGDPYCRKNTDGLTENLGLLAGAADAVRAAGKTPYAAGFAVPLTPDLDHIRALAAACLDCGIEAVELQNFGAMHIVAAEFPGLKIHVGPFANVYSALTAQHVLPMGGTRVQPNCEVPLDELAQLAAAVPGSEVQTILFGRIPLGISDECLILDTDKSASCPEACRAGYDLHTKNWDLTTYGTLTSSAREQCLLELAPGLLEAGVRTFRIEAAGLTPGALSATAATCRSALESYLAGGSGEALKDATRQFAARSRFGLCNGYLHGQSGHLYVEGPAHPTGQ